MLKLIIACNYCIHIFIILFSIFVKHLPYVGYHLCYNYTCTQGVGSVEAEEMSLRQALMYNVNLLQLFPKLALPKYSNQCYAIPSVSSLQKHLSDVRSTKVRSIKSALARVSRIY